MVRDDILEQYPELEDILNQLAGKIPTEQMAELTYQVDVEGRTVDDVAREGGGRPPGGGGGGGGGAAATVLVGPRM